jgi:hypothetical protein
LSAWTLSVWQDLQYMTILYIFLVITKSSMKGVKMSGIIHLTESLAHQYWTVHGYYQGHDQ